MLSSDVITISNNPVVVLRRATSADVEFVNELSFKIMDSVVAIAWNGRFRWESWFNDTKEAVQNKIHIFFIVSVEEHEVGYLWMNEENATLWITAIVLEKESQRQGIGDQIIKRLIKECRDNGKEAIELGVQQNNQAALDFYSKMGFVKYDSIRGAKTDLLRLQLKKRRSFTHI